MNRPANVALALLLFCVSGTTGAAVKRRGLGPAQPCSPDVCKLPDCRCSGTDIPGNLRREKVPQMIMLSFDDAVNGQVSFLQGLISKGACKTLITQVLSVADLPIVVVVSSLKFRGRKKK